MTKLFINANRTGYSPAQCDRTMTVVELMAYLDQFEDDMPVYLRHDDGHTYGAITEFDFLDSDAE